MILLSYGENHQHNMCHEGDDIAQALDTLAQEVFRTTTWHITDTDTARISGHEVTFMYTPTYVLLTGMSTTDYE